MKAFVLTFSLVFVSTYVAFSQLNRPLRAEINVEERAMPFEIVNLEEKGILVHTAISEKNKLID